MKIIRLMLALMIVAAFAAPAPAQNVVRRGRPNIAAVPPNPRSLVALQQDLINAIESMKAALPIYDGDRVRAIHAAHAALVIVDREINGPNGATRTVPTVKDSVKSGSAHTQYSAQQISDSQASMRKGLSTLQQSMSDLKGATGSNPNQKGVRVSNHIRLAIAEASKAISIHAAQG